MGTDKQPIWSNIINQINHRNNPFIVGREKKAQAAFLPFVLWRGTEGAGKSGTERLPFRAAEPVRNVGPEGRVFRLPQGLGIYDINRIPKRKDSTRSLIF